jgi:hypothetical protein
MIKLTLAAAGIVSLIALSCAGMALADSRGGTIGTISGGSARHVKKFFRIAGKFRKIERTCTGTCVTTTAIARPSSGRIGAALAELRPSAYATKSEEADVKLRKVAKSCAETILKCAVTSIATAGTTPAGAGVTVPGTTAGPGPI